MILGIINLLIDFYFLKTALRRGRFLTWLNL